MREFFILKEVESGAARRGERWHEVDLVDIQDCHSVQMCLLSSTCKTTVLKYVLARYHNAFHYALFPFRCK